MGILGYVRRTSGLGITFQRGTVGGLSLQAFADAHYASVAADRRPVSGVLAMCGGASVSWFSRTQKCVTLSSTEGAEYVALADVIQEALFLTQIWRFMLPAAGMPCIPVFESNRCAVQLAQNPRLLVPTTSNIDVRHHFLREVVGRKDVSIIHVPSQFQQADFLTKAIAPNSFEFHRNLATNFVGSLITFCCFWELSILKFLRFLFLS